MEKNKKQTVRIVIEVTPDLKRRFRSFLAYKGTTATEYLREKIEQAVKKKID
jgi:predicted DNA-binding protein